VGAQVTGTMLVGQAVAETPVIFALVVAFILLYTGFAGGMEKAAALLGAGISMGFGAFGSGIGGGLPGGSACSVVARREDVRGQVVGTMLIGQAVTQTSAIFALVVSFLLIFVSAPGSSIVRIAALLGAGISMGFGAVGPGTVHRYIFANHRFANDLCSSSLMLCRSSLGVSVAQDRPGAPGQSKEDRGYGTDF